MVQEMRDDTDWKENRLRSLTISECSRSISLTFLILVGQLSFGSSFSFQGWSPPPWHTDLPTHKELTNQHFQRLFSHSYLPQETDDQTTHVSHFQPNLPWRTKWGQKNTRTIPENKVPLK
ncbi:hypothetical protein CDAR_250691 [Caerostris darwini]|uniref:Uncharacterized protein n=1 Tax=Caerostris darwini TaxID=1538125 RepID=A0AAV4RSV5_9ARAC|nr:hypothetical protein CDAR_250691 [Caerostris darwini]